ncbi:MAG: hypothetical protein ABS67_01620 [Niabella sp. SCN 42-15]|nr:MAG: hypothetical protein ABS67_01620 [Niabella sp. SCN 42-15]
MKVIFFNILFLVGFAIVSTAANEVSIAVELGKEKPKKGFSTENQDNSKLNHFSLGSQMSFKGEKVINSNANYINFNTSITYEKGQNSYIVPFKKKVVINRVTFNPNEQLRSYSK